MTRSALSSLLIIAIMSGCKGEVESSLIGKINQECENQTKSKCRIALKDATPFSWDRLYFFGSWTTPEAIATATGLQYQGEYVPDDYRRLLFIQGGKVMHE